MCCQILRAALLAAGIALIVFAGAPLLGIGIALYPYGI